MAHAGGASRDQEREEREVGGYVAAPTSEVSQHSQVHDKQASGSFGRAGPALDVVTSGGKLALAQPKQR